jgi:hypothetical protein
LTKKTEKKAAKDASAPTVKQQRQLSQASLANLKPFQPGQSGNPKGRAKGSRNQLGEEFLSALYADFKEHGSDTIVKVREERPADYLKVVAGILPKELNVTTNAVEEMTDDELAAGIAALQSILASQAAREGSDQETKH